ncbi:MAG: AmmeMemoRadiSam system protein B [Phycisphaerae bacterium]|nr:AmmeMemoRadiSam system protein B [Phycisphaerae bacterium]
MELRKPAVAGRFYEQNHDKCLQDVKNLCKIDIPSDIQGDLPEKIVAGIVPHAGWVFSGDLAAMVFKTVKNQNSHVDTFIIFGANHTVRTDIALIYDEGYWQSPLGNIEVDTELAAEIIENANDNLLMPHKQAHQYEHSIEVQIPIIQYLFPNAKIVPIIVPVEHDIFMLGEIIANIIKKTEKNVVCIASTDLTHYGPQYGYTPHGTGIEGIRWATEVNDQCFIELATKMRPAELISTSEISHHSCGAAATACVIEAAKQLGSQQGILLAHTNSNDIMQEKFGQSSNDSVGYAAMVF